MACTVYCTPYTELRQGAWMKRSIRSLAWFAVAAQAVFVAAWIVAGALNPHYSAPDSGVSPLRAHGWRGPWTALAGFPGPGPGAPALPPGLRAVLPGPRPPAVPPG